MRVSRTTAFAAGAITALVLGSGTAYAATGGNFILGKSNTAGAISTLTNNNGTALALNSAAGSAPLTVNRGVKVANLNADKLDGKDSSAFAYAAGKTGYVSNGGQSVDLNNDGVNDAIAAVAQCPTGSQLTGGGVEDGTSAGRVVASEPIGGGAWGVLVKADASENPANVGSFAVCYNPHGAVSGATAAPTATGTTSQQQFLQHMAQQAGK